MLPRIIVVFACLCAVLALPLPTADPCKHCLVFHPFQKDNIAYCQAQNLCPIHDDAVASDLLLKVDPPTVAFNDTLSTVDFSLNFTVTSATGTGQVAVKIFTPLDEFGNPMGPPKWFGGDVTEGFAVGAQVNVAVPMLDASTDCWFCDDSEDPNQPLVKLPKKSQILIPTLRSPQPVGGYIVQGYVCNGYCEDLDDKTVPDHTRSLTPFAQKAFGVIPPKQ